MEAVITITGRDTDRWCIWGTVRLHEYTMNGHPSGPGCVVSNLQVSRKMVVLDCCWRYAESYPKDPLP